MDLLINRNTLLSNKFDNHSYLWFRYHKLFLGVLTRKGRKLWAIKFFNEVKYQLKMKEGADPFWIFLMSMLKLTPTIILFPLRLGSTIRGVPMPINERKQYTFAVKWVIKSLRDKNGSVTVASVTQALENAIYGEGIAVEKRNEYSETGKFNRALLKFLR